MRTPRPGLGRVQAMSPAQVVEHEYSLSPQSIENGIRVAGASTAMFRRCGLTASGYAKRGSLRAEKFE